MLSMLVRNGTHVSLSLLICLSCSLSLHGQDLNYAGRRHFTIFPGEVAVRGLYMPGTLEEPGQTLVMPAIDSYMLRGLLKGKTYRIAIDKMDGTSGFRVYDRVKDEHTGVLNVTSFEEIITAASDVYGPIEVALVGGIPFFLSIPSSTWYRIYIVPSEFPRGVIPSQLRPVYSDRHPDGSLLKSPGDPTVYLLEGGKKRPFSSPYHFESWFFGHWDKIITVDDIELDRYPTGTVMPFKNGTLLKYSDRPTDLTVFVVENGVRRPFRTWAEFISFGYSSLDIRPVPGAIIDSVPKGDALVSIASSTPPSPIESPGDFILDPPEALCADSVSQVRLTWSESKAATSYIVSGKNGLLLKGTLNDPAARSFLHSPVAQGMSYAYTVTAKNDLGSKTSNERRVTTRNCSSSDISSLRIADGLRIVEPPPYLVGGKVTLDVTIQNVGQTSVVLDRIQAVAKFVDKFNSEYQRFWPAEEFKPALTLVPGAFVRYTKKNHSEPFPTVATTATLRTYVKFNTIPGQSPIDNAKQGATAQLEFQVVESAPPSECTYRLSHTSDRFAPGGNTGQISVNTSRSDCQWKAVSNDDWITITVGTGDRVGNGTLDYRVAANPGTSSRTGTMTIAGITFSAPQEGQPSVPAPGGKITVDGKADDWVGIAPFLSGQIFNDTWRLSVTDDGMKMYFLAELPGYSTSFPDIFLDTDLNPTTGCRYHVGVKLTLGPDYGLRLNGGHYTSYSYIATASEDSFQNCRFSYPGLPKVLSVASGDRFIEASVLINAFQPVSSGIEVGVNYQSYPFAISVARYALKNPRK